MFFQSSELSGSDATYQDLEKAQIDSINSNRIYAIATMLLSALLFYFIARLQIRTLVIDVWISYVILVDSIRLLVAWKFKQKKYKNEPINYKLAGRYILLGTLFSAMAWGGAGLILLPLMNEQGIIITMVLLSSISSGSTTTLGYRAIFTFIFVLVVMLSLMVGIAISENFDLFNLIMIEALYILLIIFLLKNAALFHENYERMIELQFRSNVREAELSLQREKADQANKAKSSFLANMSHELRTPMHAILGFSDIGRKKAKSGDQEKIITYFTRINDSGNRLLLLLNDLLDLSKLEAGRMSFNYSQNDLHSTINVVIEEFLPLFVQRSLTVDIEPTQIGTVLVYDNDKIMQVIRNLLSNAIKYTPDGMSVLIYFEETELPAKENDPDQKPISAVAVSILDQGAGIPEAELEAVFEKFVQSSKTGTGAGGTGLGLAICRDIIRQHGGLIEAKNNKDNGAVFTFILPRNLMVSPAQ